MQVHCCLVNLNPFQKKKKKHLLQGLPLLSVCDVHGMVIFNILQKLAHPVTLKHEQWSEITICSFF